MFNFNLRVVLTITLANFFFTCFGQSIHIKSSQTLSPLSYASVLNVSKGQLHFTNETGIVQGGFEIGDSVFITHVGYKELRSRVTEANQSFLLKQSDLILDTVRVMSCKNGIKQEYSNLNADKGGGVCCWPKSASNAKVAVKLKPEGGDYRLNSFSIWLKKPFLAPKSFSFKAPIRFSFYSIDETSLLPGEAISNQQVIYYPKKEGKQTINVDSLHLRFGEAGIYVAIEYIFDEKYQWTYRHLDTAKGIDSIAIQIGAHIDGAYSKDFTLAFYNYQTNTWSFAGYRGKSAPSEKRGTIKFSAEVIKCKE